MQTTYPLGETKQACLITWFSCMDLKGSPYTKISVDKTRELLAKRHNKKIERRWCFQCTADLIDAGLITRRPRHKHESNGTIRQLSSLVAFTLRGARFLVAKRVEGSLLLLKSILAWIKNQDKRFPRERDILPDNFKDIDPDKRGRLELLAGKVLKPI